MKKLEDYKNTKTYIKFNSDEQYNLLVPLLNEHFKSDGVSIWKYASKNYGVMEEGYQYIDMAGNCFEISENLNPNFKVINASEFLNRLNYYFY